MNQYQSLIDQVQGSELEHTRLNREVRRLEHQLEKETEQNRYLLVQARTLQALSTGLLGPLETKQVYPLVCQILSQQLGWDAAFWVTLHGDRGVVLGSFGARCERLDHLQNFLGHDHHFRQLFEQRASVTTSLAVDKPALALRALFGSEEVLATPILSSDQLLGYFVLTSNQHRTVQEHEQQLHFLTVLASLVGIFSEYRKGTAE